ncbi:CheY-like chemotaxis protein [Xanthomonas arboricola]|uniref:response regulator n=3 Tax=Xanthomonas arboricola TaxID=56448 RepID=UPI000CEEB884|nr:response regulator [Xanthomonas arboricola]NIJ86123.1 CheY-like chemotaxis protein [Xanthomonas arboricola]PPT43071.1 hypothetical protein XarbCFBP8132_06885 [Xanthomonas arboricola]
MFPPLASMFLMPTGGYIFYEYFMSQAAYLSGYKSQDESERIHSPIVVAGRAGDDWAFRSIGDTMSESKSQPLVLLAEDDAAMRELAGAVLEEYGCKVIAVPDARLALEVAYLHPSLDLIVTDVFMPGPISGYDMTRELREKEINVPVLLISGWTELPGKLPDKTKFLPKPYTLASLFEILDEFLKPTQSGGQLT